MADGEVDTYDSGPAQYYRAPDGKLYADVGNGYYQEGLAGAGGAFTRQLPAGSVQTTLPFPQGMFFNSPVAGTKPVQLAPNVTVHVPDAAASQFTPASVTGAAGTFAYGTNQPVTANGVDSLGRPIPADQGPIYHITPSTPPVPAVAPSFGTDTSFPANWRDMTIPALIARYTPEALSHLPLEALIQFPSEPLIAIGQTYDPRPPGDSYTQEYRSPQKALGEFLALFPGERLVSMPADVLAYMPRSRIEALPSDVQTKIRGSQPRPLPVPPAPAPAPAPPPAPAPAPAPPAPLGAAPGTFEGEFRKAFGRDITPAELNDVGALAKLIGDRVGLVRLLPLTTQAQMPSSALIGLSNQDLNPVLGELLRTNPRGLENFPGWRLGQFPQDAIRGFVDQLTKISPDSPLLKELQRTLETGVAPTTPIIPPPVGQPGGAPELTGPPPAAGVPGTPPPLYAGPGQYALPRVGTPALSADILSRSALDQYYQNLGYGDFGATARVQGAPPPVQPGANPVGARLNAVVPPPSGARLASLNNPYVPMARAAAEQAGINPDIFVRQIEAESGSDPNAKSPAGAIGIAQFMPGTASSLGIDPTDPQQALDGAARLMKKYLSDYNGDYSRALAAYNAGPGAVQKYGGVPPFSETQNYIKKVLGTDGGQPNDIDPNTPPLGWSVRQGDDGNLYWVRNSMIGNIPAGEEWYNPATGMRASFDLDGNTTSPWGYRPLPQSGPSDAGGGRQRIITYDAAGNPHETYQTMPRTPGQPNITITTNPTVDPARAGYYDAQTQDKLTKAQSGLYEAQTELAKAQAEYQRAQTSKDAQAMATAQAQIAHAQAQLAENQRQFDITKAQADAQLRQRQAEFGVEASGMIGDQPTLAREQAISQADLNNKKYRAEVAMNAASIALKQADQAETTQARQAAQAEASRQFNIAQSLKAEIDRGQLALSTEIERGRLGLATRSQAESERQGAFGRELQGAQFQFQAQRDPASFAQKVYALRGQQAPPEPSFAPSAGTPPPLGQDVRVGQPYDFGGEPPPRPFAGQPYSFDDNTEYTGRPAVESPVAYRLHGAPAATGVDRTFANPSFGGQQYATPAQQSARLDTTLNPLTAAEVKANVGPGLANTFEDNAPGQFFSEVPVLSSQRYSQLLPSERQQYGAAALASGTNPDDLLEEMRRRSLTGAPPATVGIRGRRQPPPTLY